MASCTRIDNWYVFVAASLVTLFGGLMVLLPCRVFWYLFCKGSEDQQAKYRHRRVFCSRIRAAAEQLLSGQTKASKIVVMAFWICDLAGQVLYFVDATTFTVDDCGSVIGDPRQYTWLALCGVYSFHYAVRFLAASDKLYMWIDLYSVVDHFTIGPAFVGLFYNKNWIGLRFLRLMNLLHLPEKLQALSVLKSRQAIRLVQVAVIFAAVWLGSSGFVHVVENNGDPFHNYENGKFLPYWTSVYWLLVTMSTVGFGEISPSTDLGRAFIVLFIIGSFCENAGDPHHNFTNGQYIHYGVGMYWMLITMSTVGYGDYSPKTDIGSVFIVLLIMGSFAMFTSIVPELVRSLGKKSKYRKPYKRVHGRKHIIVCGYIVYRSVSTFIRNFIHEDAEEGARNIDIVFLDTRKPSLELEAFFRRHFSEVTFVQGTVMDLNSLESVKLRDADAVLILADRCANNPEEEDATNIMRATAVKNFCPEVRTIIQLLQYHNKSHLLHIPSWSWDRLNGDEVICVEEMKLGILAQNCLSPGISTLLSNLFTNRSVHVDGWTDWTTDYKRGAGNELYMVPLSPAFAGMTFARAAEVCFSQLDVLLVAINTGKHARNPGLRINPGDEFLIQNGTIGYFIAQDPGAVRGASTHKGGMLIENSAAVVENNVMSNRASFRNEVSGHAIPLEEETRPSLEYLEEIGFKLAHYGKMLPWQSRSLSRKDPKVEDCGEDELPNEKLDISGLFHWCPANSLDNCTLDHQRARSHNFDSHIIMCLQRKTGDPPSGLINFVKPLRASSFKLEEIKDIIIIGNTDYMEQEWNSIANFPKIWIFKQTSSRRMDLRAVNAGKCVMCVVMASSRPVKVDHTQVDKDAILTTLNIKSMFGDNIEERIKSIGFLSNPEVFRRQMAIASEIPIITEIEHDANVAFVDQDDEDDPNTPLYLTTPYATGRAFATSVLDSLLSSTFLNGEVLTLVRALITGGEGAEFERILAEGMGIVRKNTVADLAKARRRSRLSQLPISHGLLEKLQHNNLYGDLFIQSLRTYRILCLGIYRLIEPSVKDPQLKKRYVITSPPQITRLYSSDKIFVLCPFEIEDIGSPHTNGKPGPNSHARTNCERPVYKEEVDLPLMQRNYETEGDTTSL